MNLRKPGDAILTGDAVFFRCLNPATGRVKRMAKDRSWADVERNDGSGRIYTKRHQVQHLELLVPVLNQFLVHP